MNCFYVNAMKCDGVYSRSAYRKNLTILRQDKKYFQRGKVEKFPINGKLFLVFPLIEIDYLFDI